MSQAFPSLLDNHSYVVNENPLPYKTKFVIQDTPANNLLLHLFSYPDYNCKTQYFNKHKDQYKSNVLRGGQLQSPPLIPQLLHNWFLKKQNKVKIPFTFSPLHLLPPEYMEDTTIQNYKGAEFTSTKTDMDYMPMQALKNQGHISTGTLVLPLVSSQNRYKINLNNFKNLLLPCGERLVFMYQLNSASALLRCLLMPSYSHSISYY